MSHLWRQAEVFCPAEAEAFRVPKVPLVSVCPSESLICEQKKLATGLLGEESSCKDAAFLPKSILSPPMTASPSCADTNSFPLTGAASGVMKPDMEKSELPRSMDTAAAPHHNVRSRNGDDGLSYITARVQPA